MGSESANADSLQTRNGDCWPAAVAAAEHLSVGRMFRRWKWKLSSQTGVRHSRLAGRERWASPIQSQQ
jgi:hypothetical protein